MEKIISKLKIIGILIFVRLDCVILQKNIYIAVYNDSYFISLENPPKSGDFPYEPAGEYENINLAKLEELFVEHLSIKI